jgi:hypothetical protein
MTSATVTLVIAVSLSGAVIAVFLMLVAGIHAGDLPRRLTDSPHSRLEALTRTVLGVGVRPGRPASDRDDERD